MLNSKFHLPLFLIGKTEHLMSPGPVRFQFERFLIMFYGKLKFTVFKISISKEFM